MSSGKRERFRYVQISGGQIACRSCRSWGPEVVLLEPDRPLCLGCGAEQAGVDIDTVREVAQLAEIARSKPAPRPCPGRGESGRMHEDRRSSSRHSHR